VDERANAIPAIGKADAESVKGDLAARELGPHLAGGRLERAIKFCPSVTHWKEGMKPASVSPAYCGESTGVVAIRKKRRSDDQVARATRHQCIEFALDVVIVVGQVDVLMFGLPVRERLQHRSVDKRGAECDNP